MMIAISNFGSTILLLFLFAQNCLSFSPEKCPGYIVESVEQTACSFKLKLRLVQSEYEISPECSYYGSDYNQLLAEVVAETENRLKLVVKDVEEERWVVPNSVLPRPEYSCSSGSLSNVKIQHAKVGEAFKLQIFRAGSDEALIDVSDNLVFKEQLIHLTSRVPHGANIYGLGETVSSFRRNENNTRNAIWTRDWPTPLNENDYGAHPSYVEIRNGKAHGVILVNSNGMDVILSEGKVSWNVIGGIFEFYILLGPSPTEVTKQITDVIGRPAMMPLWSLGFHQCKWGYQNIWEVEEVVKQYRQNNIPLEAMWVDIDYMDGYRDFTYDPKKFPVHVVRRLQEHLKKNHQRFVAIVDPGIKIDRGYDAYDSGLKEDLFIKIDGKPFKGKVWPDWTYFPDWFHSSTAEWWKDQIEKWYEFVDIDGLWIDMNEVANFCDGDCDGKTGPRSGFEKFKGVGKLAKDFDPNNPKYKIDNAAKELALNSRTTPMDATHGDNSDILDYFVHNLYGHMESQVTYSALKQLKPRERPFVLTRSSFLGTGKYAAHWLGDNHSTWESMLFSLSELLKFNGIFGISMIGSDICGFVGNTNEELCTRWTQLGALIYPFARNHNALGNTPQEPYLFPNVKKAMEKYVYGIRYEFLPYWYTLLHLSSTYGETHVTRSLAWEFPHDNNVLDIFRQVLVGPGLLVTPVLEAGSKSVRGYLPEGVWFELESGKPIISSGSWYDFSAPLDFIPIHMRGSNIFAHIVKPLEGLTTTEIYEAGRIGFTVAASLGEKVAYDGSLALARGKLYMDEGAGLKLSSSLTNIDGISGLEVNMTLAMITLKKKKIRFPCKSRGECTAPVYTFSLKLDFKKTGPWESEISKAPTMDLVKILGVRHVLEQINRKQHAQLVFQNGRIADDHEIYVSEEFEPYALYHVNTPNQPSVRTNDDYTNLLLVWDKNQGVKLDGSNNEIIMEVVGNY